ncbi:MAG TPA: S9 family peptidase [Longimicrobium sp.]
MLTRARPAIAAGIFALAALAPAAPARAQQTLSVERIFASRDFRVQGLPALQWMRDGQRYSYVQAGANGATDLVAEDARTGTKTRLVDGSRLVPAGQQKPIEIEDYTWTPDERKLLIYTNSQPVWRANTKGTYYLYELDSGRITPVSTRPGWQMFAKLSPDGRRVGFVRDNDLYVTDMTTGQETRLTSDGSDAIINGTFDWVYEEELGLQDGWRWSPDGARIAFWRLDASRLRNFHWLNDTDSAYSRVVSLRYPKAGSPNSVARIGVVEVAGGAPRFVDTGNDPEVYLARMEWAESPNEIVIQRLNRHQNRLEVMLADARTGASRTVFTDTDSAWVEVDDDFRWINGGREFLFSSERDGFNHLYLVSRDGRNVRQVTRGRWDVTGITAVDERTGTVYFGAHAPQPEQTHLYRVKLNGTGQQQITREPGSHSARIATNSPYFISTYSSAGVPPVIRLQNTADGAVVRTLVDNAQVRQTVQSLGVRAPEFFNFRTADGTELRGSMIKPANFDASKKYPVLMYVYGGPGSQTVTDSWGGTRYLWHQALAQRGYVVVSVDNRGTGARGSAFKKATYLKLGAVETADQIEAARHLASLPWVDASRIGIWGWSYGGFMTASALFAPGSPFKAGIAVAPVVDWSLYDTIYTERFMRTPQENPEGYRRNAPVSNAANLRGKFLLVHGTGDDNVHFQNTTQLVNALQAANKQFDFMMYPNRNHGISGGVTSQHLFTMMTNWVTENL